MKESRALYRIRINNLEKGLKKWFNEIDKYVTDDFINVINGVFDEPNYVLGVNSRLYNLRNEYWHNQHYWEVHVDEYLSKAAYFVKDDSELEEELDQIFTEKHFVKINREDYLFNSLTPLKVEMLLIFKQEPNIEEDQFIEKINEISEEKISLGHGDGWDKDGRHFIIPMTFKHRILKRMKKKSSF